MPLNSKHDLFADAEYGDGSPVLVIADSEGGLERNRAAAELAGCRVADAFGVDGAIERLDRQASAALVLADIEQDHGKALDRLLDELLASAEAGRHRSLITAPWHLIDILAARAWHPGIDFLFEPDEAARVGAISHATAKRPAVLHDIGKGQGPARLQQLSEEVGRIANILASLSEDELLKEPPPAEESGGELSASAVRAMIRARRLRDQYFASDLFADPAWDMLLDLMAARLDGQRVAVSSLCIAAAVPATTALRWIKTLTDYGLFVRTADPQDGRRVFIELSDKAAAQLGAYLKAVQRLSPLAI